MTGRVTKIVDRHSRERVLKSSYGRDGTERSQIIELRTEIALLRTLDHPNIARLRDCFENGSSSVQFVMDMCKGGNLASVSGRNRIGNKEANIAAVIYQVLLAVRFLHERGIVHRDIKEENVMFVSADPSSLHVCLIDFGLSKSIDMASINNNNNMDDIKRLHTFCGTLPYMSPEVIQASYDMQSDLWSVGVLAFELLTGKLPFSGDTDRALMKQIRKARVDYSSERWAKLSPDALDLVQHLLVINPAKRWDATLALKCPWFRMCCNHVEDLSPELEMKMVTSIRDFMAYTDLRQLLSMVAAHYLFPPVNPVVRDSLRKAFMALDIDRDGKLSVDEFAYLLEKHGTIEQTHTVFAMVDYDEQGFISWTNFIGMCLDAVVPMDLDTIGVAFDYLAHGRHHVPIDYVLSLVPKRRREYVADQLKAADKDCDGYLEKPEFLKVALPNTSPTSS